MQKQHILHRSPITNKKSSKRKRLPTQVITITDSNFSQSSPPKNYFSFSEIQQELPDGITTPIQFQQQQEQYSDHQKSHISHIYECLHNVVNYENLTNQQIMMEKKQLQQYIRFLNFQLNSMVGKKEQDRKQKLSKVSYKEKLRKNNYKDQKQIEANQKFIEIMKVQYRSLKNKLNSYEQIPSKVKYERKISQIQGQLKKLRLDLIERKRKNVLSEKKIIKFDKRDTHKVYFDLQQQYVAYSKKKESYEKKLESLMQENAKLAVNSEGIDQKYIQTVEKAQQVKFKEQKNDNQEHNKLLYDTNKRRLELAFKKRQREQQTFKKRYYELLKEYENVVERTQQKQTKIQDLQLKNEKAGSYLVIKKQKISANSTCTAKPNQIRYWSSEPEKQQNSELSSSINMPQNSLIKKKKQKIEEGGGFMLTEPQHEQKQYQEESVQQTKRKQYNQESLRESSKLQKQTKSKSVFEIRKHFNKKRPTKIETEKALRTDSTPNTRTKYNYKYKHKKHSKHFHTQLEAGEEQDNQIKTQDLEMFDVQKYRIQTEQIQPLLHKKTNNQSQKVDENKDSQQKGQQLYRNSEEQSLNQNDYDDDFEKFSVSGANSPSPRHKNKKKDVCK